MSAEALLARLDGVRQTGPGRWIAKCPAHADRRPSLSVRVLDDHRLLVNDFGGCDVGAVLAAVGLRFDDLFPPRMERQFIKGERRPFPAADVLRCIGFEALVVAIAASRLGNGYVLSDDDHKRLLCAASRIQAAVQESGHA